jgi:histone deacetylase 11
LREQGVVLTPFRLVARKFLFTDQGGARSCSIGAIGWAHILDFYEQDIFPWAKVAEDVAVPLRPGLGGAEYLELLREHLPTVLDRFRPDFVVYNAGSDVLRSDPLARMQLSSADMAERDPYVTTEVRGRGISLTMVLSGGYGLGSWEAYARSIEGILTRFDKVI